jgi:hypothetical protein
MGRLILQITPRNNKTRATASHVAISKRDEIPSMIGRGLLVLGFDSATMFSLIKTKLEFPKKYQIETMAYSARADER